MPATTHRARPRRSPLAALLGVWARLLVAAIAALAIPATAHARTLAEPPAAENSPPGLEGNPASARALAELPQAPESPLESAFAYTQTAVDNAYATRGAAQAERVVIGKVGDLTRAGALGQGERSLLSELPNLGSPKANWAQNAGKLREVMRQGAPIRDATVNESGALINNTGFLRAERNLLESHGWTYNPGTTSWLPPAP